MKIIGVKEFRDKATMFLRGKEPVLITRHGRPAGIYAPLDDGEFPLELRQEFYRLATEKVRQSLEEQGTGEEEVLEAFEQFHPECRVAGGKAEST